MIQKLPQNFRIKITQNFRIMPHRGREGRKGRRQSPGSLAPLPRGRGILPLAFDGSPEVNVPLRCPFLMCIPCIASQTTPSDRRGRGRWPTPSPSTERSIPLILTVWPSPHFFVCSVSDALIRRFEVHVPLPSPPCTIFSEYRGGVA